MALARSYHLLSDFGRVMSPLANAFVSSSVKWNRRIYLIGLLWRLNKLGYKKCIELPEIFQMLNKHGMF